MSLWDDYKYSGDLELDEGGNPRQKVTCKRCGEKGLHWVEHYNSKFTLYKGDHKHACKTVDVSDGFDVL